MKIKICPLQTKRIRVSWGTQCFASQGFRLYLNCGTGPLSVTKHLVSFCHIKKKDCFNSKYNCK